MPPSNASCPEVVPAVVIIGHSRLVATLVLTVLLASGCSPQVVLVDRPTHPWAQQVSKLRAIDGWNIQARMAVRSNRKGGQATVHWQRNRQLHRLDLYGPFGSGRMRLQQDAKQATLVDSKNHRFSGRSLQQLLFRRVGWQVPFSSLQYWIVGLPTPGQVQQQQWDQQGRLRSMQQHGWQIQFSDYRGVGEVELPGRLQLDALPGTIPNLQSDQSWLEEQPGQLEQPLFRIKLIIRRWQLTDTSDTGAPSP